jgi:hypothetical protein
MPAGNCHLRNPLNAVPMTDVQHSGYGMIFVITLF